MRSAILFIALASVLTGGESSRAQSQGARLRHPPDPYGNIRWRDEKARLDNYAVELLNNPQAVGYLICYGGRKGWADEASRRCKRAADYIVKRRRVDASRVVTVDGGFREYLEVEPWFVPTGAQPPVPTPTVDPAEVEIIEARPRRRRPKR